jgi:glyoxylase-like metal-dependent hydrolase (beta-lactamase superfamily II)
MSVNGSQPGFSATDVATSAAEYQGIRRNKMTTETNASHSRAFILTAAVVTASACWLPAAGAADDISPVTKITEAIAKADVNVQAPRGNVSVLSGAGANITVYNGPEGKFIIDAGIAVSKVKITTAFDGISTAPLKYLFNTHYHWDHTDGNVWMHQAGATIVGHPSTAKHLSELTRVDDWNFTLKPLPPEGRPTVFVNGTKTMKFGDANITLKNFGMGHTDSELWVYLKKADVMVLGEIF